MTDRRSVSVCPLQLRLLRVFKLAQTWSTMRVLLSIILSTLSALGNLTFILGIVIYIFAVIGMQLFSETYVPAKFAPDDTPRYRDPAGSTGGGPLH